MSHVKPFANPENAVRMLAASDELAMLQKLFNEESEEVIPVNLEKILIYVSNVRGHMEALQFFIDQIKNGYEIPLEGKQFSVTAERLKYIRIAIKRMVASIEGGKVDKKVYEPSPALEIFRPLVTQAEMLAALVERMIVD